MRNKTHNRNGNTRCQKKEPSGGDAGPLEPLLLFSHILLSLQFAYLVCKIDFQEETQGLLSLSSPPVLLLVPPSLTPTTQVSCCPSLPSKSSWLVLSGIALLTKQYSWSSSDGTQRPGRESERQFEAKVEDFFRSTTFSQYRYREHKWREKTCWCTDEIFISGRPRVLVMDVRYLLPEIESYLWLAKLSQLLGSNQTNVKI